MKITNANPLSIPSSLYERTVPDDYSLDEFLLDESEKLSAGVDSVLATVQEFERSGAFCAYEFLKGVYRNGLE